MSPPPIPNSGIKIEMRKALFEIVLRKTQVPVELHDEIPAIGLQRIVAVVKGFHHSATGLAKTSVHSVYHAIHGNWAA